MKSVTDCVGSKRKKDAPLADKLIVIHGNELAGKLKLFEIKLCF